MKNIPLPQPPAEETDGGLCTTVLLADLCAELKDHAEYWNSFRKMTDTEVKAEMKDSDWEYPNAAVRFRGVAAGRATESRNNATSISAIIRSANAGGMARELAAQDSDNSNDING